MKDITSMKTLLFADTPLQLYNSFLLTVSRIIGDVDLLIYAQFRDAKKLAQIYSELDVFDSVFFISPVKTESYTQTFLWQLKATSGKNKLDLSKISSIRYDCFGLACPTPATMEVLLCLKRRNKELTTFFYEDGTGTYNGNVFKQPFYFEKPPSLKLESVNYINLLRRFTSFFKKVPFHYNPSAIYVKQPSLVTFTSNIPYKKIPINKEKTQKLESLLPSPKSKIEKAAFLIFDVPRGKTENFGANTVDTIICNCLKTISESQNNSEICYLREHPRSTERSPYANACVDFSGGLWELICQNTDFTQCLLVSIGSTAQLAPYIESGTKPPLLLLYRIAFQESDQHYQLGEEVLRLAEKAYGDRFEDLVRAPDTINEALNIIKKYSNKVDE